MRNMTLSFMVGHEIASKYEHFVTSCETADPVGSCCMLNSALKQATSTSCFPNVTLEITPAVDTGTLIGPTKKSGKIGFMLFVV
jgi:hypothetical protein